MGNGIAKGGWPYVKPFLPESHKFRHKIGLKMCARRVSRLIFLSLLENHHNF
jgi:hypothetical protein